MAIRDVFGDEDGVHCVEMDGEFYVYSREQLMRVCPSEAMAREVAAGV